ncbi:V-set and immunoglobulin domain-containing protein 1-like isoform X4 [Stegostoma tigrinum]|uniref:V-set and immunoglobulin domain-containing protein 1-like isoform X4 n=1 Tax=Stegostoma tigrinum TaxID=3053191 RepID=UPI0028705F62|nr:V-set and immunoglobulin domain-containing protein 1-like isoform X4 [Stegostoma tigrinum]
MSVHLKFSTLTLILCLTVGRVDTQTTLLQSPEAVTVTEGGTVTFRCDLRSSNADSTVNRYDLHWHHSRGGLKILSHYVNGRVYRSRGFSERFQLSRNVTSNSYILTIRDLKLTDSNTYICEIWGKIYGNGTRLNVTIANPPILLQSPSLERVTEGHTARLQCTIRNAAVTRTDVHWYWEQPGNTTEWVLTHDVRNITQRSPGFTERFQSFRDSSNNSFILTITNVQPNDTGIYYCKVWGDISGNGSKLTVTDPLADPVLIQYPRFSKVPEGETVEFQCAMHNASVNDTDVHWHYQQPGSNREWVISQFENGTFTKAQGFHDRVHASRNVGSNSYILRLVNVTLNDSAVYHCSVWSYIYGAGSQLNVTEQSEELWLMIIIGVALAFVVLLCIFLIILLYVKKWACFQHRSKPEGTSEEELNTVYATVSAEVQNKQMTASPPPLEEGELYYADIQFFRKKTEQPATVVTEESTEYAAIKYT